jgi:hypothetical protein
MRRSRRTAAGARERQYEHSPIPPPWVPATLKRREPGARRLSSAPENPSAVTLAQTKRPLAVETRAPWNLHECVGESWHAFIAARLIAVRSDFDGGRSRATAGEEHASASAPASSASAIADLFPARRIGRAVCHEPGTDGVHVPSDPPVTLRCPVAVGAVLLVLAVRRSDVENINPDAQPLPTG